MNLGFHKQVPRDGIIWKVQQGVTSSAEKLGRGNPENIQTLDEIMREDAQAL